MRALLVASLLAAVACAVPTPAPEPAVTPRGTAAGPAVSAQLGPAGGRLATADGRLALEVPPGALAELRTITLTPVLNFAPGGLGLAYDAAPDGLEFSQPVRLVFTPSAADRRLLETNGMGVAWQRADGQWEWLESVRTGETVSAQSTHFTNYSLVPGALLSPGAAFVKERQSLALEVVTCTQSRETSAPLYECDSSLTPLSAMEEWSVNGVPGGDATVGTVAGAGAMAIYTAPARRPSPSTVAVTVRFRDGDMTALLFSRVAIGEGEDLEGSFDIQMISQVLGNTFTVHADATLTFEDEGPDEVNYDLGGTAAMKTDVFQWGNAQCILVQSERPIESQSNFKVLKDPAPAVRWSFIESWDYECKDGQYTYPMAVVVQFATMKGSPCTQFADVATADVRYPRGTFTMSCQLGLHTSATWDFAPVEP